jgi:hypothetical protein
MKKLALGLILLALVAGCGGGGSSSGGGPIIVATKEICQGCSLDGECLSGRCVQFKSGIWRCIPHDAKPGYTCPSGMYKTFDGQGDSCQ